MQMK